MTQAEQDLAYAIIMSIFMYFENVLSFTFWRKTKRNFNAFGIEMVLNKLTAGAAFAYFYYRYANLKPDYVYSDLCTALYPKLNGIWTQEDFDIVAVQIYRFNNT